MKPAMRFGGCDFASRMNAIYAETVNDLITKVEMGQDPNYKKGFLHTSTFPHNYTNYYNEMWSRDSGRGLIEIARLGFAELALPVARYMLSALNDADHWGRIIDRYTGKSGKPAQVGDYETDGNALILLGIYNTWLAAGREPALAKEFLQGVAPVIDWIDRMMQSSPYGGLLPCKSELSGNPNTPYVVYAVYPNYGIKTALAALKPMAEAAGDKATVQKLTEMHEKLTKALSEKLVEGERSWTPEKTKAAFSRYSPVREGCWINGIDSRDGSEYSYADWDSIHFPIYAWTRQLPFIFDSDLGLCSPEQGSHATVNSNSYEYILEQMCKGIYFRKYGFVSNTCWEGMRGRHDDTMTGYGQGFMTQAAILMDDVNAYTKLLEGVARLAYDGDVMQPTSHEMNPWILHECFDYDAYENAQDHTAGFHCNGRFGVMENPGDEGNLVQEAEPLKAMTLMSGIENGAKLRILPRIPWTYDTIEVKDFPVFQNGQSGRISYHMEHERWLRKVRVNVESTIPLDYDFRVGPFPQVCNFTDTKDCRKETTKNASWIWKTGLSGKSAKFEIELP